MRREVKSEIIRWAKCMKAREKEKETKVNRKINIYVQRDRKKMESKETHWELLIAS